MMIKLILLLVISHAIASPFYQDFYDADGQCWRCYPGWPCERCIRSNNDVTQLWNPFCPTPNCNDPDLRHILFPSRDVRFFFQCIFEVDHWDVQRMECQCDTIFNFGMQNCVTLRRWTPFCVEMNVPMLMKDCESGENLWIGSQPNNEIEDNMHHLGHY